MSYILSNANRWYCTQEAGYGQVAAITAANRIPAVSMKVQNQRDQNQRKDKTGTRTWLGLPAGMRRHTSFDATSYMRDWPDPTTLPPHGPLLEAAMGAPGLLWLGATTDINSTPSTIYFVSPHNLNPGQAIVYGSEMRFVAAVVTPQVVVVNAPFSSTPAPGIPLSPTATYALSTVLPSISLFDYWDPSDALQRILSGVGVDRMTVSMNGDFHQFEFQGMAQDVLDSASFQAGQGGLATYPVEPAPTPVNYALVPGNLGEVWMGVIPNQMFTVTQASIEIKNNLGLREKEYGTILPLALAPGAREVTMNLEFFSQDDVPTAALYQAARQQTPLGVMFQLGQTAGQLAGVYMQSLIPDVPEFKIPKPGSSGNSNRIVPRARWTTNWWWHLDSANEWGSRTTVASAAIPGVEMVIARMTFGRRLELMRRVRDLAARIEYFDAGRDEKNRMEASLLGAEMDRLYLAWGLEEVRGLALDGVPATPELLVERGPESLVHEALTAIKAECGITETERKN